MRGLPGNICNMSLTRSRTHINPKLMEPLQREARGGRTRNTLFTFCFLAACLVTALRIVPLFVSNFI